ncbi:HAD-IA family hydrolase [Roseofilum capinflatum]|uniref:HAD-IA family hydrolase n=1 Tax=Roseofilum capinflatum BLCC-M114 TaxID=3022440 RepID=A0ABT7B999_9CYAN|nr:HAD-IA family hydrolase [Roseofilum capinflatum]MDJ1175754.1 HAD-IA family hydrolase [Roseofilum capinflatum BLCC-M114]
MPVSYLIFDFDGTLAQSLDTVVDISNRLAPEFGYQSSSPEELDRFRTYRTQDTLKKLGVSWYKLPFLMLRLRKEMNKVIHTLNLVEGMAEVLQTLKNKGCSLGIITSNDRKNVKIFLENHQLAQTFDFIESELNLFGKGRVIKKMMRKQGWSPQQVYYVGDEVRDIEAAQKIGVNAIAVSWGFQFPEVLCQYHPDFLLSEPRELITVVESIDLEEGR